MREAGKAARLLLSANPTVTELRWLPNELQFRKLLRGNRVTAPLADPQSRAGPVLADAQTRFDRTRSALPVEPDRDLVQDWLLRVRKALWVSNS